MESMAKAEKFTKAERDEILRGDRDIKVIHLRSFEDLIKMNEFICINGESYDEFA